jgi:TonB family protein
MNDGGERTPERAAQPSRVVRLVAFAASALLIACVLFGVASLRYPLTTAPDRTTAPALLVAEAARPLPVEQPRAPSLPPPIREREPDVRQAAVAPIASPAVTAAPPVITAPVWLQRPRNTARYYPREAFMQGVEGQVVLDCMVEISGLLECSIASETPSDKGFGAAALAIAAAHVMQPATQGGAPVRARYRMIVPFSTRG